MLLLGHELCRTSHSLLSVTDSVRHQGSFHTKESDTGERLTNGDVEQSRLIDQNNVEIQLHILAELECVSSNQFQLTKSTYISCHTQLLHLSYSQDEPFHIPQTQQYCSGDFQGWDPKITTFPGLYLLGTVWAHGLTLASRIFGNQVRARSTWKQGLQAHGLVCGAPALSFDVIKE